MRLAIFSDLHGNPYALDAILERLKRDGPFDRIIAAGDLAFGGSDPAACIDRLREAGIQAVYGNTEEYIHSPDKTPGDDLHLKKWDRILEDVAWYREALGPERVAWLHSLPFDIQICPTEKQTDCLLIFHANPKNIENMLLPPVEDQFAIEGQVFQPDDSPELVWLFEEVVAKTVVFGHYHFSSLRNWQDVRLVNVAPASMPAKDGDPRTRFTVLEWEDGSWTMRRRLIEYEYRREIQALRRSSIPNRADYAATFPD